MRDEDKKTVAELTELRTIVIDKMSEYKAKKFILYRNSVIEIIKVMKEKINKMKNLILILAALLMTALLGCGEDNPLQNGNNNPPSGDSLITLSKDTIHLMPFTYRELTFGTSGLDSINCILKIEFKATWNGPVPSDSLAISLWGNPNWGMYMLDTVITPILQKDVLNTYYLDSKNYFAHSIIFSGKQQFYLYQIKAYKH